MAVETETWVHAEITIPSWQAAIPVAYPKGDRRQRFVPFRIMCGLVDVERKRQLAIGDASTLMRSVYCRWRRQPGRVQPCGYAQASAPSG
jgi:hypothetical protein